MHDKGLTSRTYKELKYLNKNSNPTHEWASELLFQESLGKYKSKLP